MQRVIGGLFPLAEFGNNSFCESKNKLYLCNARSGLYVLYNLLKAKSLWLPSYVCKSLINPFYNIKFYNVDVELNIKDDFKSLHSEDLVLIINYFGKPIQFNSKAFVVEDCCQALPFNNMEMKQNFRLQSFTKFSGFPDGSLLESKDVKLDVNLSNYYGLWWWYSLAARFGRKVFDKTGIYRGWYQHFCKANTLAPTGGYHMTAFSKSLKMELNPEKFNKNFNLLYETFPHLSVLTPGDYVPTGFPIHINNRNKIRQELFKRKIYPPIHWELNQIPPHFKESHQLSRQILTIPCDQRYDEEDIQFVIKTMKELGL